MAFVGFCCSPLLVSTHIQTLNKLDIVTSKHVQVRIEQICESDDLSSSIPSTGVLNT
jgi:hypothetical protein